MGKERARSPAKAVGLHGASIGRSPSRKQAADAVFGRKELDGVEANFTFFEGTFTDIYGHLATFTDMR